MTVKRGRKSARAAKTLPARALSAGQARGVQGGHKHLAGVKYDDLTVQGGPVSPKKGAP